MLNAYSVPTLVALIVNIGLGWFVLSRGTKSRINQSFFLWSVSLMLWHLGVFFTFNATDAEAALFASRIAHAGVILIPPTYLFFVLIFLGFYKDRKVIVAGAFFLSLLFEVSNFTQYFLLKADKLKFGWYGRGGILYLPFLAFFIFVIMYCLYNLWRELSHANVLKRQQIKFLLLASCVGYFAGTIDFLPIFGVDIFPIGNPVNIFFVGIVAYAIIRHRLMDIDVIIRRTLVFAGLLAFVFGVFSAATFLVQEVLVQLGLGKTWIYAISLFVIVLGYDPIRNFMLNLTDRYLFQKKYNYQQLLKDATRGMSKIESLNHLLSLVVHFITMKMRVRNGGVLMRRRDNEFELCYQRGYDKNFLEYRLDDTNPMIAYMVKEKEAVDLEQVKEYIEAGNKKRVKGEKKPHEYDFQAIKLSMEELQCACVVPSFLGRELKSILLIGEKKSGDFFSTEDLTLLYTLAQESAIAIENAKLFDEALAKSSQLAKINEQLEYSRNLLMKALRETEIANKQLQDTQAQLIHEQKMATLGRLAASVGHEVNNPLTILSMNVSRAILKYRKNPDLKVGEVLDLFQKMEQNIGRIKAVVNTLTGLLKKSEKGKFEPLSLKLILEETLPLVQFQTYLDNLSGTEVDFDIPGNTPLIRGDLERLQEVFLNLFINAYHAMQGRRNRRIRVTAEPDPETAGRVAVHFTDNGSGMTEEVMKKIFNYGFTTKPPGRGSGMGLYMCKYIVELHGGEMKVRSKLGEGTTFTIYLPSYEETSGEMGGMRIEATN